MRSVPISKNFIEEIREMQPRLIENAKLTNAVIIKRIDDGFIMMAICPRCGHHWFPTEPCICYTLFPEEFKPTHKLGSKKKRRRQPRLIAGGQQTLHGKDMIGIWGVPIKKPTWV